MTYYRKKPVVIEAMQWDGTIAGGRRVIDWGDNADMRWTNETPQRLIIRTLEGEMKADPSDFIIKGVNGEFYPCKPDIFAKTYEEV